METTSSKGSSKRKPAFTMKVKLPKTKKIQSDSDDDDCSDQCPPRKSRTKGDDSDQSDVESIPDLPEGTVVVKPEAVKEKKPRFSGPEFSKTPENLDIVNCTSCGRQINPNVSGAAKRHPKLKVLVCRKCFVYYRSGKIEQDEDGLDEQCRWCGEGGRLSGCDFCHNAFCKSCIIRNFSRAEFTKVMSEDGPKWKCYVCEPAKLKKLLQECDGLFKKIEKEKMKAKMQSKNADSKKSSKSSKSDGKSSSGRMFNKDLISVSGITVNSTNLVDTVSQLLGLTAGFQTMLEVLKSGIVACGDVEHSSRDLNRGAKTLETGLRQFLKSLCGVVADSSKSAIENGETTEDESIVSNGLMSLSDDEDVGRKKTETKKSQEKKSYQRERKKSPERVFAKKEPKMNSSDVVEIKDSFDSDIDSDDDDLPISFGPVGGISDTKPKDEEMETETEKEEVNQSMTSLGETENEAAQLELLQELAEEMCKEQKGRKEKKEEEEKKKNDDKKTEQEEEKDKDTGDCPMDESDSMDDKKKKKQKKEKEGEKAKKDMGDSPMDESDSTDADSDDVSSSDLLMSSDSNFDDSKIAWPKRTKKDKDRQPSRKTKETKTEKKKRKKREKKEKKEKKERRQRKKKKTEESKPKAKKKKVESSDSEDDLDKEIDKLEEEPKKRKKKDDDDTGSSDDDDSIDSDNDKKKDNQKKNQKKSAKSSEDTKGKAKQEKKKKVVSSSSDDDNDDVDDVDEEDEDEDGTGTKMKNGKSKHFEEENGDDLVNEIAKKALMAEMDDDDEDENENKDDDDSDSDEKSKKGKGAKAGAKKSASSAKKKKDKEDVDYDSDVDDAEKDGNEEDDEDEGSDSDEVPNKRKRMRSKLLNARISGSDSDKKKKAKKKAKTEDSDSDEMVVRKKSRKKKNDSSEDEDSEEDKKKKKKKRKGKDSSEDEDSEDDKKKKKKKGKGKGKNKKKKQKKGKKRKLGSDSDSLSLSSSSSSEDSDSEVSLDTSEEERREKLKAERKAKRKAASAKRRRIKQQEDSSDEDKKKSDATPDDDDSDDDDDDDDESKSPDKSGRKNIRKIKSDKKLTDDTKRARKAEEARRKRVVERQKAFNHVVTIKDEISECPITTQLILEVDKETKEPIIQVNKKLVRKLKPHQVEACQFIWDCLCESLERMKKKEGSGCILAHCMGLGKTLSVISFVHTMLQNEKLTKMRTCLIVCPLNTVINWRNEWDMWFEEKDKVDIYEISSVKQNWPRADYLKDWQEGGGIMIIGYEMYRNLTASARIKNKKLKAIFESTLVDPGPDLVVCDEGHILKNDSSAVSQAMNKIRTRRRVVLTGTPLQNNLVEYHCMTSFVKPNLMGTRKEFLNRFVNPITNGQHSDSTAYDVKVMGRRAHVLHEMLAGCVQRRDYSALTKFLPPKFEYVISVRLTPKQIELYQKYLDLGGISIDGPGPTTKGARLFSDYQNLMKIWTHPWVLKLSEIRAEQRMKYDDSEDSFIDNSTSEGEGSMSNSDSSDSEKSKKKSDSEESQEAGPSSGIRRSRRGKPPPEDSDKDEVVKDWKTRSRGGEGDDDDIMMDVDEGPRPVSKEWWAEYVKEEDENQLDLGGKLILLFEILRMCEDIGDKVLIFSQSLLSLDIIEYFLDYIDKQAQEEAHKKALEELEKDNEGKEKGKEKKDKDESKEGDEKKQDGEKKEDGEKKDEDEPEQPEFGKSWTKGADYFRMDGSTSPQLRSQWADVFNDPENFRARLFLISTRAGSLGINLVAANRVIIFDASWNPSHDVQSIFRVYRFGQTKPCYVYRFLAQGTMEEKIYERQVTKQSLSQRVVDEHQIDRHFTANDLTELYNFKPDRLDDPNRQKVVHSLPKDVLLAELLKSKDSFISKFHEHDSLLENRADQTLSEEDKKAAWEEYENERQGVSNRVAQASTASGMGMFSPDNVMQIVQMVKMRFPNLPPDMFQAQVQAILQQQILYQQSLQKQQIEQQRMMEMQRLHRIQQDIRSQQRQINSMTRNRAMNPMASLLSGGRLPGPGMGMHGLQMRAPTNMSSSLRNMLTQDGASGGPKKDDAKKKPPTVIDLSNS